jgi:hypothetical protein
MKVDILPFSTFKDICLTNSINELIGTQCIYPLNLQIPILKTFIKNDEDKPNKTNKTNKTNKFNKFDKPNESNESNETYTTNTTNEENFNNLAYCFEINKICFYPKYTYSDLEITYPIIVISDYFYNKYFLEHCTDHILNIIYNIPIVKMIRLKRIKGDFPSDDSIEHLLTNYFEACSIVNINQEFELDLYDYSQITFKVDQIIYKNDFAKNINQRIVEMNNMIQFNTQIVDEYPLLNMPSGIAECESIVTDYEWHYHTLGEKKSDLGYLVNAEVEIDFIVSELEIPSKYLDPLKKIIQPIKAIEPTEEFSELIEHIEPIEEFLPEILSAEELRRRRLAFFNKTNY